VEEGFLRVLLAAFAARGPVAFFGIGTSAQLQPLVLPQLRHL
jgi:hypothetical protein